MMWRATHASCTQGRTLGSGILKHMDSKTCFLVQEAGPEWLWRQRDSHAYAGGGLQQAGL